MVHDMPDDMLNDMVCGWPVNGSRHGSCDQFVDGPGGGKCKAGFTEIEFAVYFSGEFSMDVWLDCKSWGQDEGTGSELAT
jgi:hypothetical protein